MKCKTIDRLAFTRARCPNLQRQDSPRSVGEQIIAGLKEAIEVERTNNATRRKGYSTCPSCGQETLIHEDGCMHCRSCGWSACG